LPLLLLFAVLLSLLFAELAYRTIEKPSMDAGRRIALRLTSTEHARSG
jgi:peptidoglycan/LPS O-acetylase OafA/YrhL